MILLLYDVVDVNQLTILKNEKIVLLRQILQTAHCFSAEVLQHVYMRLQHRDIGTQICPFLVSLLGSLISL